MEWVLNSEIVMRRVGRFIICISSSSIEMVPCMSMAASVPECFGVHCLFQKINFYLNCFVVLKFQNVLQPYEKLVTVWLYKILPFLYWLCPYNFCISIRIHSLEFCKFYFISLSKQKRCCSLIVRNSEHLFQDVTASHKESLIYINHFSIKILFFLR